MGCRCRLHRRHDRPPIRPGLTGDGHEVVHPENGSDATGREHVLGEPVADRSIGAGHVERRRKGCVQGELGGVGVGCRRRRSSGHGSMVRRRRDRNPGEKATTLGRLSGAGSASASRSGTARRLRGGGPGPVGRQGSRCRHRCQVRWLAASATRETVSRDRPGDRRVRGLPKRLRVTRRGSHLGAHTSSVAICASSMSRTCPPS
jgi:hypothetical protein